MAGGAEPHPVVLHVEESERLSPYQLGKAIEDAEVLVASKTLHALFSQNAAERIPGFIHRDLNASREMVMTNTIMPTT